MASIYNIAPYKTSTKYGTNNIVSHNGSFYYSKIDENSSAPTVDSANWGGTITIRDGLATSEQPYLFWSPSYGETVSHQPTVQTIQFGDGYKQRLADGTHNNLLSLNLSFKNRGENETAAIVHFLAAKEGYLPFYFKCPAPYSIIKKFTCSLFTSNIVFQDNYNVTITLEEVA